MLRFTHFLLLILAASLCVSCGGSRDKDLPQYPDRVADYRPLPLSPAKLNDDNAVAAPAHKDTEKPYRDVEDLLAQARERGVTGDKDPQKPLDVPSLFKLDDQNVADAGREASDAAVKPEAAWAGLGDGPAAVPVSISVDTPGANEAKGKPSSSPQPPVTTVTTRADLERALTDMIGFCETRLKEAPGDTEAEELLVMLYLLRDDIDKAFTMLQGRELQTLDARTNLVTALAFFLEGEVGQGATLLERYLERLRPQLPLAVSKSLMVEPTELQANPQAFGRYTDLTGTPMQAGEFFGLYLELDHFTCTRSERNGFYRVSVHMMAEIHDAEGTTLPWRPYKDEAGNYELQLNSRLRDLAPTAVMRLPVDLPEGAYTLVVTVKDNLNSAKQTAVVEIPFTVLRR